MSHTESPRWCSSQHEGPVMKGNIICHAIKCHIITGYKQLIMAHDHWRDAFLILMSCSFKNNQPSSTTY